MLPKIIPLIQKPENRDNRFPQVSDANIIKKEMEIHPNITKTLVPLIVARESIIENIPATIAKIIP